MDLTYAVDDFDEKTASSWQRKVAAVLNDRATLLPALAQAMCDYDTQWKFRDMKPFSGGSEVSGDRGRGLGDQWAVWLMR